VVGSSPRDPVVNNRLEREAHTRVNPPSAWHCTRIFPATSKARLGMDSR
jgi:hypothetical protein